MRVLLVDDNKSTTKMISKFLESGPTNYQISVADNGLQALEYYSSFKPDVVVLDISMPGMDGIETLSRIFKIDNDANVIMATANDSQRTIQICLQRGAIGYVSKPYSPEELITTIENTQKGGIYKRDLTTFFSRTANKIVSSIHKMIVTDATVVLKDIEVIPKYSSTIQLSSSVRSISENTDELKINVSDSCVGFSTEVGGQIDGTIISVISKEHLRSILQDTSSSETIDEDTVLEFFNIVNTNVLSQLADSMNVKVDAYPIRHYIKDKDEMIKNKDLTKVKFEISIKDETFQLEVYLWLNMEHLFKYLF